MALFLLALSGCTTIDPGPNFVIANATFNEDYFICHVEPQFLVAKKCGSGDPAAGDKGGGCHFNASAVGGLALIDHAPVDCGGGDHPVNQTNVSSAQANAQAASMEMSRDYKTAPIYVRPLGFSHPRAIFTENDPVVDILRTWSQRP